MTKTQDVFEIPITTFGGCAPGYRARLAERLGPVPAPGETPDKPWALHRRFKQQEGRLNASSAPDLCLGALGVSNLSHKHIVAASPAEQDLYGGIAWSLLSELDHYGECRSEMEDRNWFRIWSAYSLPNGTLICPDNPSKALEDLMIGFGANAMQDKIARGVFCVLADEDISNHARLELGQQIDRLIAGLLAFFCPPDIPGEPIFRLRVAA